MDAYHDPSVREIAAMLCSQIGKSEIILNIFGYHTHVDPCPILMIQPTVLMAEDFSKDRIAPMIRDTPVLTGLVADARTRDSGNTILHKTFPGGHFTLAGANSPASLASRPIRTVLADEIDRYPTSAGSEGDPTSLAEKRQTTFWNAKTVKTSTPSIAGVSKIEEGWEESDQRLFYVPCPHCGEFQPLWFSKDYALGGKKIQKQAGYLKWDKRDDGTPTNVSYVCGFCEAEIRESEKGRMLQLGAWYATKPFKGVAGFHLNALYSPWIWWIEIVKEFFRAKKQPELLQVFVNTRLGQPWEERGEQVNDETLFARRERYVAEVPGDALILTAGVDVQDDRLEMEVVGWGPGEESWGIEYRIFYGDTSEPEVWQMLDDRLARRYVNTEDEQLPILATCIDSRGHRTQIVYEFCRTRERRRVFAIMGVDGSDRPAVGSPSAKRPGLNRRPCRLFPLGVDSIKATLYSRLKLKTKGRGFCHFPLTEDYDEEHFAQLTAEKRLARRDKRGLLRWIWISTRPRNDALDCRVYAIAALYLLKPDWEEIEKRVKKRRAKAEGKTESPPTKPKPTHRSRPRKGGWLNSWR